MKCTGCGKECVLEPEKFAYHDGTIFSGYVCYDCNALYVNEDDSILRHDAKFCKQRVEYKKPERLDE